MTREINPTLQHEIEQALQSFCKYFDWEMDSEQISNIRELVNGATSKASIATKLKVIQFLTEEYGYQGKHVDIIKPSHGSCCCCMTCGQYHDECVCENNRIHAFIQTLENI